MMKEPKKIWKKMEKWGIFLSLGSYFILQILSSLEVFSKKISDSLLFSVLGISVISALHYLIREVESMRREPSSATFPKAFHEWIRPYDSISDLSVLAFTSYQYYHLIRAHLKKIGHLRLLLNVGNLKKCSNTSFDLEDVKFNWISLQKKNKIRDLEIRMIKAHSNFYFSIAESQRMMVGLLWPDPDLNDLIAKDAIIISKESDSEGVKHFEDWFESMWKIADLIYPEKASNKS